MKKALSLFLMILLPVLPVLASGNGKPAYKLYTSGGKEISYQKMTRSLLEAKIVFFGELHDNPIAHWLQYELTLDMYQKHGRELVIGGEMFETDDQLLLDEYISGIISVDKFEKEAKIWPNYSTDYRPIVDFARENDISFVATNIPRRYAALVSKKGFDGLEELSDEAKKLIAPLPIEYDPELPGYKGMLEMHHHGMPSDKMLNFPKAQALKDATMAYSIIQNLKKEQVMLHFNGTYHTQNYEGIVWYVQQLSDIQNIKTIATVEQGNIEMLSEEYQGIADFILVVPNTMTKTH